LGEKLSGDRKTTRPHKTKKKKKKQHTPHPHKENQKKNKKQHQQTRKTTQEVNISEGGMKRVLVTGREGRGRKTLNWKNRKEKIGVGGRGYIRGSKKPEGNGYRSRSGNGKKIRYERRK